MAKSIAIERNPIPPDDARDSTVSNPQVTMFRSSTSSRNDTFPCRERLVRLPR